MITFDLSLIDWSAVSAVSSLVIAGLGFAISFRLRDADEKRSQSLHAREEERYGYATLVEYRRGLIEYSVKFFDVIVEIQIVLSDPSKDGASQQLSALGARVSSLVDEGRFLFPNFIEGLEGLGRHKGSAFEGLRRPPLDVVLAIFHVARSQQIPGELAEAVKLLEGTKMPLSKWYDESSAISVLVECRRAYLNLVQPETFPREVEKRFRELLGPVLK
jgi:hypothetical protein